MSFYMSLGRRVGKTRYVPYPNRFFSLSDYYMPADIKQLFHWCVYFYYKNPVVGAAVNSMAMYPITQFTYSVENESVDIKKKWKEYLEEKLNLKRHAINIGIDSFVFGNGFVIIYYPFTRVLECQHCKKLHNITDTKEHDKNWELILDGKKGAQFKLKCAFCGKEDIAKVNDMDSKNFARMSIVRLNPRDIDIEYNDITGEKKYFYNIPTHIRAKIKAKKQNKDFIRTMPKAYLDAIAMNRVVLLNPNNLFHLAGNSVAAADQAWGKPLIIHSLQKLFYVYTLLRAQEAIATQKIIPMDILYPADSANISVIDHINIQQWQERVKDEIEMWRRDPNYISVMPIPIGMQRMGGEGKMLMLTPEIQQQMQEIIAGFGVPQEFVFGGLTWTGSSVSLRMLENKIMMHRDGIVRFAQFIADAVHRVSDLPPVRMDMTELRMTDDMSRMQLFAQLNASNKLSDEDFLNHLGFSNTEQYEKIKKEMKIRADLSSQDMLNTVTAQGEAMIINAEYSAKAQIAQQKINNLALNDLDNSLPVVQREQKRLNDLLNLKMLNMQFQQALMQEQQMMNPPPPPPGGEGGPPPPEGEGGGGPPPEGEGGGGPPPEGSPPPEGGGEQGGLNQPGGSAPTGAEQEAQQSTAEPPVVNQVQYSNPFYQGPKGPDIEAMVKRWATKLKEYPPDKRAEVLSYLRQTAPKIAERVTAYMTLIPPGGTASDANQAFYMHKKL